MSHTFDAAVAAYAPELPLAVAYSGGADSSALLLACARRWPGQVYALHVHHGLQAAADDFEAHCRSVCERWQVPLAVAHVDARHQPGESPEAAAREARYASFEALVSTAWPSVAIKTIALAQHADDQVETILLALSRGGGPAGLAGMPARSWRAGVWLERPLLAVPGAEVRRWLQAQEEPWIEDPSNTDTRYTRNRIRAQLLPALASVFPQFRDTFARSARHAAQAQRLLEELAAQDLAQVGVPPTLQGLRALGRDRQANVLRYWLATHHATTPSAAQLEELLDQVAACSTRGHRICLKVGRGTLVREGPALGWYN